jgi:hypothetical protein
MASGGTRERWLDIMLKIASPVIDSLSKKNLKKEMPVRFHPERSEFAALEAFGRTICGIAPWLELDGLEGTEAARQNEYRNKALMCIETAVNPQSPDYMNFGSGGQPLVDAAFLAHGLLRAPDCLAAKLERETKRNLTEAFKQTKAVISTGNNWLFFSAMIEAGLLLLGEDGCDIMRVDYAFKMFEKWYAGDGMYSDGEMFHWDYYNSFVIQPMMIDILNLLGDRIPGSDGWKDTIRKRAARYAAILERLIAPDGSYPAVGRSLCYRFGVFQLLSQAALERFLPDTVSPAQVRCGLTAVIDRICGFDGMFDGSGWLQPGVCGYQPELAEGYISTGSLYLCTAVFPALGLSPEDEFWSGANEEWSSKKIWSGKEIPIDHAIPF